MKLRIREELANNAKIKTKTGWKMAPSTHKLQSNPLQKQAEHKKDHQFLLQKLLSHIKQIIIRALSLLRITKPLVQPIINPTAI